MGRHVVLGRIVLVLVLVLVLAGSVVPVQTQLVGVIGHDQ